MSHDVVFLTKDMLKKLEGELIQSGYISSTERWGINLSPGVFPNHNTASNAVGECLAAKIKSLGVKYVLYDKKFSAETPDGQSGTVWQSVVLFIRRTP